MRFWRPDGGPIAIPGRPNDIGVWVNGNSGVGGACTSRSRMRRAGAGLQTATKMGNGTWRTGRRRAASTTTAGVLVHLPLPALYPSGYYQPSFRHWQCQGNPGKDFEPAYPIKLARLYILLREKLVYVTDMTPPAGPSIELRDLTSGTR